MRPPRICLLFAIIAASLSGCGDGKDTSSAASAASSGAGGTGGAGSSPLACPTGFADCDGNPGNGCEGALLTSAENCGACGVKCQAAEHQAPLCSAGTCIRVCEPGFGDCDGNPGNGCEVDTIHDIAHCGACDRQCKSTCEKGACDVIVLATAQAEPADVVIDETHVYWGNTANSAAGAGSIMKVAKSGGAPVTLADKQSVPWALALDASTVYWVNLGSPPAFADGAVLKVPKDGSGAPVTIATGQATPLGIAVQGSAVYWTTADQVMMIDKDDPAATPVVVASGQKRPVQVVAAGTALYWNNQGTSTGQVPNPDGSIMMLPQGGAPVALVSNLTAANELALDATAAYLYWRVEGAIMRLPLAGGAAEVFADTLKSPPWQIAADGAAVYWTELLTSGGAVNAASASTKERSILVPNQTLLWGIAIDQTSVYWASYGDGKSNTTGVIAKIAR